MEVVVFEDSMWEEIPEQDNPALGVLRHSAVLIYKTNPKLVRGIGPGYTVAYTPIDSDLTRLGVFWTLGSAELFADAFVDRREQYDFTREDD